LKASKQADYLISVSPDLGRLLLKMQLGAKWFWVPNVVAARFLKQDANKHFTGGKLRFLNLALLTEKKGQKDLLVAFSEVYASFPNTELWLAGDGPIRRQLEELAQELNVAKSVKFLGNIKPENVPKLMQEIDVMVIASHYETFGVVAAEALIMGRPVIATRCGGPECIVTEHDGLLVEPHAPEQLAEAMVSMVKNISRYDSLSISEHARKRFSGEAVASTLTKIYQKRAQ